MEILNVTGLKIFDLFFSIFMFVILSAIPFLLVLSVLVKKLFK